MSDFIRGDGTFAWDLLSPKLVTPALRAMLRANFREIYALSNSHQLGMHLLETPPLEAVAFSMFFDRAEEVYLIRMRKSWASSHERLGAERKAQAYPSYRRKPSNAAKKARRKTAEEASQKAAEELIAEM